jgi:hypothetical protein
LPSTPVNLPSTAENLVSMDLKIMKDGGEYLLRQVVDGLVHGVK